MKKPRQYKPKKSKAKKVFNLVDRTKKYDKDWTIYRFRFLAYNKNCYACGVSKDDTKIHIDHIYNARKWPDLFDKLDNHLPLCISCHSTVTARFESGRKLPDTDGKIEWINNKRKDTGTDVKVRVLPYYKK